MPRARARLLIALAALLHCAAFIAYQRTDWSSFWTDQTGYMRLGAALADTGRFTRYPDSAQFVPEAIRTPGYPVFLAALDLLVGQSHLAIAIAQGLVFAITCLLVYELGRTVASEQLAFAAGLATALFPPLPYFAALALTEVFTAFLATLAMLLWLRVLRRGRLGLTIAAGLVLGWTALTRPTFQYLPLFLVAAALVVSRPSDRPERVRASVVMLATFVAMLIPWLIYNAVSFRTLTFTPAGGPGRQLFEGSWQVELSGRVETELTAIADATPERAALDRKVREFAADNGLPADPMLRYVHQHQDIRRIWTEPQDPWERTNARIAADREYLRVGLENIRLHPVRHAIGRLTRGTVILWATEIPVRYSDINKLSPWTIRAIWLPQALLMLAAVWGVVALWRRNLRTDALVLLALPLYVTAVHVPLYAEARYSLPAKPVVLLLAVVGVAELVSRRHHSPAISRTVTN